MANKIVEEIILKIAVDDTQAKAQLKAFSKSIIDANKNTVKLTTNMTTLGATTTKAAETSDKKIKKMSTSMKRLGKETKKTSESSKLLGTALKAAPLLLFINKLKELGSESIQISNDFERVGLALKTAFGPEALGQMQFITAESERLGVNVLASAQGYAKLANSTKIAGLSSKDTQEIFTATAEAATALGLSGDDVNGVLRAFAQIASKGKVQAEELMQIAERGIPIQAMMAKALGVSNEELQDMAQKGEILAVDALPKMAQAIRDTFHEGALNNANSTMAINNRTMNIWQENLKLAGNELKNVTTPALNTAAKAWDGLTDMIADGMIDVLTWTGNIETLSGALADVRKGMRLETVDLGGGKDSTLGIEVVELDKISIAMSNFLDTVKESAKIDAFRESLGLTARGFVKIKDAIESLEKEGLTLDEMKDPLKEVIKGMKELDQLKAKDLMKTETEKEVEALKNLKEIMDSITGTLGPATFGLFGENLGDFDQASASKAQAPQAGLELGTAAAAEFLVRPTEDTNKLAKESLALEKKLLAEAEKQTGLLGNQNNFEGRG